jgi:hypothetical protein
VSELTEGRNCNSHVLLGAILTTAAVAEKTPNLKGAYSPCVVGAPRSRTVRIDRLFAVSDEASYMPRVPMCVCPDFRFK